MRVHVHMNSVQQIKIVDIRGDLARHFSIVRECEMPLILIGLMLYDVLSFLESRVSSEE